MPHIPPHLAVLDGWEVRHQVTYVAKPQTTASDNPMVDSKPLPRTNLVVSVTPLEQAGRTPEEAAARFLRETGPAIDGLQQYENEAFEFADGYPGWHVSVEFPLRDDVVLRQDHFFRTDGEMLTQIVVTQDRDAVSTDDAEKALEAARQIPAPALGLLQA